MELEPELHSNEKKLEQRLDIGRRQAAMLRAFSQTFNADNTTPEKFEAFLDSFANRQNRIDKASTALEDELTSLRAQMANTTLQAKQDRNRMKALRAGITVMVSATGGKRGDARAEIKLTYAVSGAWWAPHYDVRAVTTDAGDAVRLHYQALVAQSTGEDWTGVNLSLSTSQPLQRSVLPTLEPQWLSVKPRDPVPTSTYIHYSRSYSRSPSPRRAVITGSRRSRSRSRSPVRTLRSRRSSSPPHAPAGPPDFMRTINAQASDNAVSTTYAVAGFASIPSGGHTGGNGSGETHKVTIAELEFAGVVLEWSCVPKKALGVHLQVDF